MQLLMELLQVWGDKSFLNHTSYEQHHYLTQALILCMAHITEQQTQEHKDGRELMFPKLFLNSLQSIDCGTASNP